MSPAAFVVILRGESKPADGGDAACCCRMYATAAARSDGLLLLCGGRDVHGTPLADAYGFARHRDGRWEWHAAPGSMPSGRYQHGSVFVGTRLHISGGAVGGGRMVGLVGAWAERGSAAVRWVVHLFCAHLALSMPPAHQKGVAVVPGSWAPFIPCHRPSAAFLLLPAPQVDESTSTVMLDTSGGAWITPAPGTLAGEDVTRRCRHAVTSVGPFVFIYGGLKGSTLLDDLLLAGECCCFLTLCSQLCWNPGVQLSAPLTMQRSLLVLPVHIWLLIIQVACRPTLGQQCIRQGVCSQVAAFVSLQFLAAGYV